MPETQAERELTFSEELERNPDLARRFNEEIEFFRGQMKDEILAAERSVQLSCADFNLYLDTPVSGFTPTVE